MHVYVQKSTRTTLPLRPSGVNGSELSQTVEPLNDGSTPSIGRGTGSLTGGWVTDRPANGKYTLLTRPINVADGRAA